MSRTLRHLMVAVLAAGSALFGTTGPAAAAGSWSYTDTMEATSDLWYFDGNDKLSYGYFRDDIRWADSGTMSVNLNANGGRATWASVGRGIRLPAGATACHMSMRVDPVQFAPTGPGDQYVSRINLEVIDRADFSYQAIKPITLTPNGPGYFTQSIQWQPTARLIFVRVALLGDSNGALRSGAEINVDTLQIGCTLP
jgi:hypothetical protein